MSITKQEIADHVREYFDVDTDEISDKLIARWTNMGWLKISRKVVNWPNFQTSTELTTAVGQRDYPLPLTKIISIHEPTSDGTLQEVDGEQGNDIYGAPMSTGRPAHWSVFDNALRLYPTPNAAITLEVTGYRQPLAPLSISATDPIDLPTTDAEDVLLMWVLYEAAVQQDDFEKANGFRQEFNEALRTVQFEQVQHVGSIVLNSVPNNVGLPTRLRYDWE